MAQPLAQGTAKTKYRDIIINLDDYRDILESTSVEEQPEGWYTAKQIIEALSLGENKGYDFIRNACKSGQMEFANLKWHDWDGVNRQHRVYRVKK